MVNRSRFRSRNQSRVLITLAENSIRCLEWFEILDQGEGFNGFYVFLEAAEIGVGTSQSSYVCPGSTADHAAIITLRMPRPWNGFDRDPEYEMYDLHGFIKYHRTVLQAMFHSFAQFSLPLVPPMEEKLVSTKTESTAMAGEDVDAMAAVVGTASSDDIESDSESDTSEGTTVNYYEEIGAMRAKRTSAIRGRRVVSKWVRGIWQLTTS